MTYKKPKCPECGVAMNFMKMAGRGTTDEKVGYICRFCKLYKFFDKYKEIACKLYIGYSEVCS